jgi:hypothetical protein
MFARRVSLYTTLLFVCVAFRVLREAKASVENECNQLRLRNDTLSQQLSLVHQEMVNVQQDKNNTISDLRAELKMKGFELTTLGVTFEVR